MNIIWSPVSCAVFGCAIESGTKKHWNYFQCFSKSLKTTPKQNLKKKRKKNWGCGWRWFTEQIKFQRILSPYGHKGAMAPRLASAALTARLSNIRTRCRAAFQSRSLSALHSEVCRIGSAPSQRFLVPPAHLTNKNWTLKKSNLNDQNVLLACCGLGKSQKSIFWGGEKKQPLLETSGFRAPPPSRSTRSWQPSQRPDLCKRESHD